MYAQLLQLHAVVCTSSNMHPLLALICLARMALVNFPMFPCSACSSACTVIMHNRLGVFQPAASSGWWWLPASCATALWKGNFTSAEASR